MALMSPKYVSKLLKLLLDKHFIARRYPCWCLYDKDTNPVLKISEKKFSRLSTILVEDKRKRYKVSRKKILELHGGNILKTQYKEIRCQTKSSSKKQLM